MSSVVFDDIVKEILTANVYDVAKETPLGFARKISRQAGHEVFLKREDLQSVHSFKLRGAYNKISKLNDEERRAGVIASSAGNHAQGVALAAKKLGISALIVMPITAPDIKVEAVRALGAEVELFGDSYSETAEYCQRRAQETGRTFVHAFDDPLVIAGQGTIGREILEQNSEVTHVFVPIGGGGLIAGIAGYIKSIRPDVKVIGVEPIDSNAMQMSIHDNERVTLPHVGIFADGVAVKQIGENTFKFQDKIDDVITVSTDQICVAIKSIFEDTRSIVEPAGALAVAGIMSAILPNDAKVVAICSGANMTFERLHQVAERTILSSDSSALLALKLPEKPGALRQFCETTLKTHNISEFNYRLNQRAEAHVLVGISTGGSEDKNNLLERIDENGYNFVDLSNDDTAKEHVRHMVGGSPRLSGREQIYEVTFPERPGALGDFLDRLDDEWNISLFHYKTAASDWAKVLIGFEADDPEPLEVKLETTGFSFTHVNHTASIALFL